MMRLLIKSQATRIPNIRPFDTKPGEKVASAKTLSDLTGLNISTITRRHDAALRKAQNDEKLKSLSSQVIEQYHQIITQESHKLKAWRHSPRRASVSAASVSVART